MRELQPRVYGPNPHGRKWRVEIRVGGAREYHPFESESEAAKFAKEAREAAGALTLDALLSRYEQDMTARSLVRATRSAILYKVRGLLGVYLGQPPSAVTEAVAKKLYKAAQGPRGTKKAWAPATHRSALVQTKTFWGWLRAEKIIRADVDPWRNVAGVGKVNKGKPQLGEDESRTLMDHCFARLDTDVAALPTAVAFMLGMRASEVVGLTSRNIDSGGKTVRLFKGKTANAARPMGVPAVLVEALGQRALAAGGGRLWEHDRHWLHYHVKRLCREAGVPQICPHGLRGTHSTLAVEEGQTAHAVARQIGHGNSTVTTRQHYIAPGTLEAIARKALEAKILGDDPQSSSLQPETLELLQALIANHFNGSGDGENPSERN